MKSDKANDLKVFAGNLVRLRKIKKLTQEKLAENANLSAVYIAHLEQARKSPTLHTLSALTKALDTSIKELFRGISK
jgi:transcriptional regulator with XRE-family HTH domain